MMFPEMRAEWIDTLPSGKQGCLGQIQQLQSDLLEAAEDGDWVRAAELERERANRLKDLYANMESMGAEAGESLARITERLIEGDRALMERVERERSRLGDELGHLRRGQKAVNAYTDHAQR